MKKLIILLITIFFIYLIYSLFSLNRVKYLSISDIVMNNYNEYINKNKLSSFNNDFITLSINKLHQDIKNNRTIRINNEDKYLKKELRESDVLVISVGMDELKNNYDKYNIENNYQYFNEMYLNIKRLIKEIKKYAYGKIVYLGYYNPTNYYDANIDQLFYDMDIKLNRLMMNNDIIYIDLYELVKGNNYKEKDSCYLNINGNKKIASIIEFYLS